MYCEHSVVTNVDTNVVTNVVTYVFTNVDTNVDTNVVTNTPCRIMVKKLRYYARFLVVSIMVNKMDLVLELKSVSILNNYPIS